MRSPALAACLAAPLLLAPACGSEGSGGPAAAPSWPAGTALAVDDEPISAAEVERAAARVGVVYPEHSRSYQVRQGLESLVLPRAALRLVYASERAQARAACDAAWERIRARGEPPEGLAEHRVEGNWGDLTLFYWDHGRSLEPGGWSGPLERIGHFALVQLVERGGYGEDPAEEELHLRVLEFPYLPAGFSPQDLNRALASVQLTVVDPAYDALVPEDLRYRMTAREKHE